MVNSGFGSVIRKRCPKCKSGDIRKRVRHYYRENTKIYRCYQCSHEFDTPFIGTKI